MKNNEFEEYSLARISILAAAYAAVTILITPIAYGPIQFRISDVLLPLPYNRKFGGKNAVIGLTIGTLIANLASPFGIWDQVIGTFATFFGVAGAYYMRRFKYGMIFAAIMPVISVTILIGFVLLYLVYDILPLWLDILGVFVGEIVTSGFGGYLLLRKLETVS
ncbi:MAG: QueT transporter family protein [Candidatus Njordarchaeum guaymaensis]